MTAEWSSVSRCRFNADPFFKSCGRRLEEVESAGDSPATRTITILTDCKERHFTGQVGRGTPDGLKCAMEWECHRGVTAGQNGNGFCTGDVTCKRKKYFTEKRFDISLLLMNTLALWIIPDQAHFNIIIVAYNEYYFLNLLYTFKFVLLSMFLS